MPSENTYRYSLEFTYEKSGSPPFSEEGTATLEKEALHIDGLSGQSLHIPYREMEELEARDYRVFLRLNNARLEIYFLGYHYDEFSAFLTKMRNELFKEDLLMHEKLLYCAEDLIYEYSDSHKLLNSGRCEAQVSDTALILAEPDGNHLKFPLSYISKIQDIDYTLSISMESREHIRLKMLGRQREPLLLNLEGAIKKLEQRALALCKDLFPDVSDGVLNQIAPLFKDGRGVSKNRLDSVYPWLWKQMEAKLELCGIAETYRTLGAMGLEAESVIGFKRDLMGELTGDYIWFFIPIAGHNGKILAMEAGTTDGSGGKATYFFKMPTGISSLNEAISLMNYSLFMINFRREPIYLTEEQLAKPNYAQYRYAINKLPSLRLLRSLFIGRISHSNQEKWKSDVELLVQKSIN